MPHPSPCPPCHARKGHHAVGSNCLNRCKCWAYEKACLSGLVTDSFLSKLIKDLFPFQRQLLTLKQVQEGPFPLPGSGGSSAVPWPQLPGEPVAAAAPGQYPRSGGELGGRWWWSQAVWWQAAGHLWTHEEPVSLRPARSPRRAPTAAHRTGSPAQPTPQLELLCHPFPSPQL